MTFCFSSGSHQEVNITWYSEIEEPLTSREKHYSLVFYILTCHIIVYHIMSYGSYHVIWYGWAVDRVMIDDWPTLHWSSVGKLNVNLHPAEPNWNDCIMLGQQSADDWLPVGDLSVNIQQLSGHWPTLDQCSTDRGPKSCSTNSSPISPTWY